MMISLRRSSFLRDKATFNEASNYLIFIIKLRNNDKSLVR